MVYTWSWYVVNAMAKNDLAQISKILTKYQTEVNEALQKTIKDTAKQGVNDLKVLKYAEKKYTIRTGKYNKGWTSSKERKGKYRNAEVIHNRTDYQLTHLLEFGHMTRDGVSRTRAFPHIEPTRDVLEKEALQNIEDALEKI